MTSEAADPVSLESFVEQAGPALQRALAARCGVEDGRDAAADAMAWAVAHWDQVTEMNNPVGYLYRVAQSSVRRQRRWRRPDMIVPRPADEVVVDIDLQRALMRLRVEQRVAVLLVHGFGYRYRDVADLLDTTTANVTNHVNRGLARLRTLLEES